MANSPYRTPPDRDDDSNDSDRSAIVALVAVAVLLGIMVALFGPRSSSDPEPRGHGGHFHGGHGGHGGGHR
jgi:hypothetical protein